MHRRIATEVPVSSGRLLDVGCGPAALTREIARSRPPALEVTGIDPSAGHDPAGGAVPRPPNLELRVTSPAGADLADEIDFAPHVLSFHHWEEPLEELEAIHRALQPGGRLWIYEPDPEASAESDPRRSRPLLGRLRWPPSSRALDGARPRVHGARDRADRPAGGGAHALSRRESRALRVLLAARARKVESVAWRGCRTRADRRGRGHAFGGGDPPLRAPPDPAGGRPWRGSAP